MSRYDAPYQETDAMNPHYAHLIQPWDDGAWHCLDCDGPLCVKCHREPMQDEEELCGECISEEAEYWADMRDMQARGYDSEEIARGY